MQAPGASKRREASHDDSAIAVARQGEAHLRCAIWFRSWDFRFRVSGFEFRVSGVGCRVPGSGFRVPGIGFRVSDFGFRVSGFGFRVSGLGFSPTLCEAVPRRARIEGS